jgi:hypothetical protein
MTVVREVSQCDGCCAAAFASGRALHGRPIATSGPGHRPHPPSPSSSIARRPLETTRDPPGARLDVLSRPGRDRQKVRPALVGTRLLSGPADVGPPSSIAHLTPLAARLLAPIEGARPACCPNPSATSRRLSSAGGVLLTPLHGTVYRPSCPCGCSRGSTSPSSRRPRAGRRCGHRCRGVHMVPNRHV